MAFRVTGKVVRIYPRAERTNIRLAIPDAEQPLERYFSLELSHPNYNALYSLALSAAVNGYPLQIRTTEDIKSDQPAFVSYMVVDW